MTTARSHAVARDARWRARNPIRANLVDAKKSARYRAANRHQLREKARRYRESNKEAIAERRRNKHRHLYALYAAKARARKGGLPFDLDAEWYLDRLDRGSALSGIPFSREKQSGRHYPYGPSIDRIDPSLGYVKSNCRLILVVENSFKSVLTDSELVAIARRIVQRAELL